MIVAHLRVVVRCHYLLHRQANSTRHVLSGSESELRSKTISHRDRVRRFRVGLLLVMWKVMVQPWALKNLKQLKIFLKSTVSFRLTDNNCVFSKDFTQKCNSFQDLSLKILNISNTTNGTNDCFLSTTEPLPNYKYQETMLEPYVTDVYRIEQRITGRKGAQSIAQYLSRLTGKT